MQRSRQGIGAAVVVLLSLSALGCTGGRPGTDRSDLQAGTEASSTLDSPASTAAGSDDGQPSGTSPTTAAVSGGTSAAPGGSGGRVPGAPVSPGNRNNQPQALGAPIKIPAFQQVGAPIGEVFGSIEAEFAAVCGGRLCVKLVIQPANADPASCGFQRTDPPAGATVRRDTTVALVCTPEPTDPSETIPPDDTPPDDTTPPDDSQPPSSS
jgi:hypothetical protein